MRLDRPVYRRLPACRGRSDEEVDRLTREIHRRRPSLAYYPILALVVLVPIADLSPRLLERWCGVQKPWPLIIAALVFGLPMILFEWRIHFPAVNREMERLIAERGSSADCGESPP